MLTRDSYVALLEKRAADAAESAIEAIDSAELMTQQRNQILSDDRQYLHNTFSRAGEVESGQSATVKKLFNNVPSGAITGTTLLKVARAMFKDAMDAGHIKMASPIHAELALSSFVNELEKIAGLPNVSNALVRTGSSFRGTLNNAHASPLGNMHPTNYGDTGQGLASAVRRSPQGLNAGVTPTPMAAKLAALQRQTLSQVAAKNRTAMSLPQKTWNLSSPGSAAGAGMRPQLPQGSGTSVAQPGFFGRLLGR